MTAETGFFRGKSLGATSLLTFAILSLAWFVGFASRLFAIVRFESIIHEFDPWYVYPGLMVTSGLIHWILDTLNFHVHIREICVFLAPTFSGLTAIATYLLTKELWSAGAGLFAACFIAISPGYTSRSVAGSYDNEGIAIFALQFTYYLWVKSLKTGSVMWASFCALSYFYMVSAWGGYVFIINLIPLHVLALIVIGRYSSRLFVAYTTFYCLATVLSMQIPFVGFQPVRTSEHMPAFGVFGLLQIVAAMQYARARVSRQQFMTLFVGGLTFFGILAVVVYFGLVWGGYVAPFSGRFYSLWDTGYAKVNCIHIPIIASVSEHQPTTWVSFFFDLHITAAVFPVGLWYCVKNVNDERVFSEFWQCFVFFSLQLFLSLFICTYDHTVRHIVTDQEGKVEEAFQIF
ncbi:oligosaccharyl transferase STT3 subunit [Ancylostoma ceylanicum]|uniref:dolichyl-diphosphooligosaccharide--protein glycotransferase n=1 Tax=Ancylostoma ceylanicum TaxID=53326 RepID=A0A0D6LS15_9BILA|nr:oligosaccharyl transferase STT3 subunit [Ancylostoma ceylanicum]